MAPCPAAWHGHAYVGYGAQIWGCKEIWAWGWGWGVGGGGRGEGGEERQGGPGGNKGPSGEYNDSALLGQRRVVDTGEEPDREPEMRTRRCRVRYEEK